MKFITEQFNNVNKDYRLMLLMLFIMKIGQFMIMPFLAINLAVHAKLTPAIIGLIVGAGPLVYGLCAILAGVFIDHYGVKKAMIYSLFGSGIVLFFFFQYHATMWYFLMSALTGFLRSFFDIGARTYGITTVSTETRKFLFSLRFMAINTAAACGPALGAYLTTVDSNLSFKLIGALYFLLGFISIYALRDDNRMKADTPKKFGSPFKFLSALYQDTALMLLTIISLLIWAIYSQLDSTLAQYLHAELNNGVKVYSLIIIINAIGCATLQIFVSQWTKKLERKSRLRWRHDFTREWLFYHCLHAAITRINLSRHSDRLR